jgi:predicted ATPase
VADYAMEIASRAGRDVTVSAERCVVTHANGTAERYLLRDGAFEEEIPGIRARLEPARLALFAASATPEFEAVYSFLSGMRAYEINPDTVGDLQSADPGTQLRPDGGNAAAVLRRLKESDSSRFELVSDLVRGLIPGVSAIGTMPVGTRESIRFDEVGPGPAVTLSLEAALMSAGTLRVLGLLLAAYQPVTPTVLMIEEPEANVHPAIAESLTSVLIDASRRSQVIITTHSPDILDHADLSDDVFRVVAKANGQTAIAPVAAAARQAIREHLYSPGELLRIDELGADLDTARMMADGADLFGPAAHQIDEAA